MPESTKVTWATPQATRFRDTAQPSVPAPKSKHFVAFSLSTSRSGRSRQRISSRFSVAAAVASSAGSLRCARSTDRGPMRPAAFGSQPTPRLSAPRPQPSGSATSSTTDSAAVARMHATRAAVARNLRDTSATRFRAVQPGCAVAGSLTQNTSVFGASSTAAAAASVRMVFVAGSKAKATDFNASATSRSATSPPRLASGSLFASRAAGSSASAGNANQ